MKLTIVGATGGIGRHLVSQALAAGHDVTAVVRNPAALDAPVRTVRADLSDADPAALTGAVAGADAVLSGLGRRGPADAGVVSRGTAALLAAMTATGVRRIVVVSAAPISTVPSPGRPHPPRDPGEGPLTRYVLTPLVKAALREPYADLARMEDLLRASDLDWTVIRPPRLTDKPRTGRYRVAQDRSVRRGLMISRADVADLMVRVLGEPDSIRHAVSLAN